MTVLPYDKRRLWWLATATLLVLAIPPFARPVSADLVDLSPPLVLLPVAFDAGTHVDAALSGSSNCQAAATVVQVEACMGPGAVCDEHPTDPSLYKCTIYCWEWENDPDVQGGCSNDGGRSYAYTAIGYYYCPPRGVQAGCDDNG